MYDSWLAWNTKKRKKEKKKKVEMHFLSFHFGLILV